MKSEVQLRNVMWGIEHQSIVEIVAALLVGAMASIAGGGISGAVRNGETLGRQLAALFGMFYGVLGGTLGVAVGVAVLAMIR
jgi:hypothetical protein